MEEQSTKNKNADQLTRKAVCGYPHYSPTGFHCVALTFARLHRKKRHGVPGAFLPIKAVPAKKYTVQGAEEGQDVPKNRSIYNTFYAIPYHL